MLFFLKIQYKKHLRCVKNTENNLWKKLTGYLDIFFDLEII